MADLGHGAIDVVRDHFHEDRDAGGSVAFIRDLFVRDTGEFAGTLLDRRA